LQERAVRETVKGPRMKLARAQRVSALPTASGGIARAAYARAVNAGLDVSPLLRHAGLSRAQIRKTDVRFPVRSQIKFLNEVADRLADDYLGLHLAQSLDLRELGLVYYVLASSQDLQTALMRLARYSAIHNEGVHIGVSRQTDVTVSFDYVGVARLSDRHQIEFFIAILLRLCRQLTGRHLRPVAVRLMHRRAHLAKELAAFFGCALAFGAPADQVVFSLDVKCAPLTQADPYLNELLLGYCEETLSKRRVGAGDWRCKVENVMVPLLPHGEATLENVAQRMGMSHRTLARRLAREGISFLEVLQDLRLRLAQQYFGEPDISITQVAWLLGYRGPSAFTHAFKRWTGRSPRQMRVHAGAARH
jgi:AraC-like DNA-binding protein